MAFSASFLAAGLSVLAATARHPVGIADAPAIPWLRIVLALLFCLILSAAAILMLRRFGVGGGGSAPPFLAGLKRISGSAEIEIIETRRASAHGQVCLFHCRGNAYLISITSGGTTLIDKMPVPPTTEPEG